MREHHIKFCKVCELRKKNFEKGLVCSLTNELADFEDTCANFVKDHEENDREFERQMIAAGGFQKNNPTDYKKTMDKGAFCFF